MPIFGDNPFDDGLDFAGCPPRATRLRLPKFPEKFEEDSKLICWGRCDPFPNGIKKMQLEITDFKPDQSQCGVYSGVVHFADDDTGDEWYSGSLKFYYTRNYPFSSTNAFGRAPELIAFRFVVKGDIVRLSDKMPEWQCLILCTKRDEKINSFEKIFVYGGLDIIYDPEKKNAVGLMLGLGHNDGWFTHHPRCSRRPIDSIGRGDYIGHYCDKGWLFVSPGRNFFFDPNIMPPTGRFFEEALREVGRRCITEDSIEYGSLAIGHRQCINWYQKLKGNTDCNNAFESIESCQGLYPSGERHPWLAFFSMGYWKDQNEEKAQILHLVEGTIKTSKGLDENRKGTYFYGFSTQNPNHELKLVDLASNKDVIGEPADTKLLIYLYNAGLAIRNPKLREILPIDSKLSIKLHRMEMEIIKEKEICPFLKGSQ